MSADRSESRPCARPSGAATHQVVRIAREDSSLVHHIVGSVPAQRVLSPVRGCALAAPSPPFASFAPLTPRGGSPGHPRLAHTPLTGATRDASIVSELSRSRVRESMFPLGHGCLLRLARCS